MLLYFPGAAQHEVMRCRPGTHCSEVPDQRRTATLRFALRRIRDTEFIMLRDASGEAVRLSSG